MDIDPYVELGVVRDTPPDEIKKAYRKLALKLHPDKNPGDADADAKFRRVAAAYAVLSDPDKKTRYDVTGRMDEADAGLDGVDMSDIFSALFMGGVPGMPGFGMMPNPFHPRGHAAHVPKVVVGVSMREVLHGVTKTLKLDVIDRCGTCNGCGAKSPEDIIQCMQCDGRGQLMQQLGPFMMTSMTCPSCAGLGKSIRQGRVCPSCHGKKTKQRVESIDVAIPRGVPNGHEHVINGVGNFDVDLGRRGSILIQVVHDKFEHEIDSDHNVLVRLNVTLADVLCGMRKEVDICGEKHTVESDAYFDPSKTRVLSGLGLPKAPTGPRGNLHVSFDVKYDGIDAKKLRKCKPIFEQIFSLADAP